MQSGVKEWGTLLVSFIPLLSAPSFCHNTYAWSVYINIICWILEIFEDYFKISNIKYQMAYLKQSLDPAEALGMDRS